MTWHKVTRYTTLQREQRCVYRHERLKILVIDRGQEHVQALENRCPHQGYPLEDGMLDPEKNTLTCNHHLWEFSLGDGRCTASRVKLSIFQAKVEDGEVWVEIP